MYLDALGTLSFGIILAVHNLSGAAVCSDVIAAVASILESTRLLKHFLQFRYQSTKTFVRMSIVKMFALLQILIRQNN